MSIKLAPVLDIYRKARTSTPIQALLQLKPTVV
jgi:hypothetical protein